MAGTTDLNLLALFVAVADANSFSEAARRLGLPKSTVSRGVAQLEASLDTRLLHRTTRQASLTTAGTVLYERTAPLLSSLREAVGTLPEREETPSGDLRITVSADMAATFMPEVMSRFLLRYPSVRLDVLVTNRVVDIVSEGVDLALRVAGRKLTDSSLIIRRLTPIDVGLFASPLYLARKGTPRSAEDLAGHEWVRFRGLPLPVELEHTASAPGRLLGDDMLFLREMVRCGMGIGWLPTFLTHGLIASGELVRVVPGLVWSSSSLALVYARAQHVPRKVTAFRDFLLEHLASRPLGQGPPSAAG